MQKFTSPKSQSTKMHFWREQRLNELESRYHLNISLSLNAFKNIF